MTHDTEWNRTAVRFAGMTQTSTHVVILLGSLRTESYNRRIAERLQAEAPAGVTVEIAAHLSELPFYNEELDGELVPRRRPDAARARRPRGPRPGRHARVQRHHAGRAEQRHRLALPPVRRGALKGKPFAVVGATATRFGGKWSHEDARRSAAVAGADVVPTVVLSHSTLDADVFEDPEVFARVPRRPRRAGRAPSRGGRRGLVAAFGCARFHHVT